LVSVNTAYYLFIPGETGLDVGCVQPVWISVFAREKLNVGRGSVESSTEIYLEISTYRVQYASSIASPLLYLPRAQPSL
jgi:hypothetical protein